MIKKITHLTSEELDRLLNIWLEATIEAHPFIEKNYWLDNQSLLKEQLPQAELYVYMKDGKIVAFLGMIETYIAGLFVHTDYQNQGIGQQLLAEVKKDHKQLSLSVYVKNQRALHFYQKQGFRFVKENVDETGELEHQLVWDR
ncbi:N-acetyltransferase [Candidatus Enterococcus mansonii]|uniref:N-acetyltransferase domain-containing protein n=1 Tax=Candidatus Enterococcus mansonii TaxID=1834181 RepID=A0A242CK58_9ENTE|nr:N-acetyltransferase [Enterococcus sp. 4G2_DIV0659]OTO10172.1 hypothetical protein A5880_000855 [Enterococcus sp. 4G2_DIV0659]